MTDVILVEQLELQAHIGVTAAERAAPQRLTTNLRIEPGCSFAELGDAIEQTIDYAAVCEAVQALSLARPRQLIETLADEIAKLIVERFAAKVAEVELRKFVLPNTAYVAVRVHRERR